jgi:uncharacterized protein
MTMNRHYVIETLRVHESALRESGIVHLSVFGSVARGDASRHSDVDLVAELDQSKRYTLVSLGRLESEISDMLGAKVDLSASDWLKEPVRKRVMTEAILAF